MRRRRRPPMDWLVASAAWGQGQLIVDNDTSQAGQVELCGVGAGSEGTDPPNISRFLIRNIRGQIGIHCTTNAPAPGNWMKVYMGIKVTEVSVAAPNGPVIDLTDQRDASDSWMWLHCFTGSEVEMFFTHTPIPVNIRVRRVLKDQQKLIFYYSCIAGTTSGVTAYVTPFLRVLISGVS